MVVKIIAIHDEKVNTQELKAFINSHGRLYISVGDFSDDDSLMYQGFVTLSKKDVVEFVGLLTELAEEME